MKTNTGATRSTQSYAAPHHNINSVIEQADWIASQSNYENVNDLWQSDPDLFVALAIEYRDNNPWD